MLEEFVRGEAFAKRVTKCEAYAASHPKAYRRRVLAMAWLGYWLVPVIMIVLLAPPAYVFWEIFMGYWPLVKKVIYGVFWGFYALGIVEMARAMFVPYHPVEGLDVTEADAPELFAVNEQAREKLNAPKLDRVVLTDDLNAAAAQVPKRSFLAKTTNELIIGLPLLEALEHDELQAVIAHELGHFSGAHGRDGVIVGRTTRAWEIALETSQTYGGWTAIVPVSVAKWFVPRFMAYSFALRRDNEFFADRASVEVVGAEAAGRTLIRSQLAAAHASDVKDEYLNEALDSAYAPKEPLAHLYSDLANATANSKAPGCLLLALYAESDPMDTHPGLKARLEAIGTSCKVPAPVRQPAIQLLGEFARTAYERFNAEAHEFIAETWVDAHSDYLKNKNTFEQLNARAETGKLDLDDALTRAQLSDVTGSETLRLRCFSEAVCWYPNEARALYAMGMYLAQDYDMRAIEFLESAVAADDTVTGTVLNIASDLAAVRDDASAVEAYRQQAQDWYAANAERIGKFLEPSPGGQLQTYESNCVLEEFSEALGDNSHKLARAYLVTKPVPEWLEQQVWLIGEPRLYGHFISADELSYDIYESAIEAGLPPAFRIWVLEKDENWLREQVAGMPGALIWSSDGALEGVRMSEPAPDAEAA